MHSFKHLKFHEEKILQRVIKLPSLTSYIQFNKTNIRSKFESDLGILESETLRPQVSDLTKDIQFRITDLLKFSLLSNNYRYLHKKQSSA